MGTEQVASAEAPQSCSLLTRGVGSEFGPGIPGELDCDVWISSLAGLGHRSVQCVAGRLDTRHDGRSLDLLGSVVSSLDDEAPAVTLGVWSEWVGGMNGRAGLHPHM